MLENLKLESKRQMSSMRNIKKASLDGYEVFLMENKEIILIDGIKNGKSQATWQTITIEAAEKLAGDLLDAVFDATEEKNNLKKYKSISTIYDSKNHDSDYFLEDFKHCLSSSICEWGFDAETELDRRVIEESLYLTESITDIVFYKNDVVFILNDMESFDFLNRKSELNSFFSVSKSNFKIKRFGLSEKELTISCVDGEQND